MFRAAVLIGFYAYFVFVLGLLGMLHKSIVTIISTGFFVVVLVMLFSRVSKEKIEASIMHFRKSGKLYFLFSGLFLLQSVVNLIGALGPELAFDALWYHLTLPKLFLSDHTVYHIPGGLLYYSDMPKLAEMLYVGALSIGDEIFAKVIHYSFGILSCGVLFLMARKHTNSFIAFLAVVIFYSNLVVGWLSITAYVDLIRTFFEISAIYYFLEWVEKKSLGYLVKTGILIGLAISTKLLAIGTIGIFFILIIFVGWKKRFTFKKILHYEVVLVLSSLLIPLPWFIVSFLHTGNPFFPLFSPVLSDVSAKVFNISLLNPVTIFFTFWNNFTRASDPITPLYIIFFPLVVYYFTKKSTFKMKILFIYVLLAMLVWYVVSQVEGTRMLVPYLPVFSLICAVVTYYFVVNKKNYGPFLPYFLVSLILFSACISIIYRGIANKKYVPVLTGQQSKHAFLSDHLNYGFADFYDTDRYFYQHIKPSDRVLLYGFHNLYYVDFPYIDSSWIEKGDKFNYIAVQKAEIPERYKNWQLIYTNDKTTVKLYKPPKNICNKLCVY